MDERIEAVQRMHPFYYPLFVHVVDAFRLGMYDVQGNLLPCDHFVRQGEYLKDLKHKIAELLDAQDGTEDISEVIRIYHMIAFQSPLVMKNVQAEFVTDQDRGLELVMAVQPQTAEDIWNYLLTVYVSVGLRFRRCDNCRRFFATTGRGNPKFCERIIAEKGKSCREVMPKLNFNSKAEKDPAVWLYNRAYKTMYSRVGAGTFPKESFKEWAKRARTQRDACSRGEITPEIYSAWLSDNGLMIDYLKDGN